MVAIAHHVIHIQMQHPRHQSCIQMELRTLCPCSCTVLLLLHNNACTRTNRERPAQGAQHTHRRSDCYHAWGDCYQASERLLPGLGAIATSHVATDTKTWRDCSTIGAIADRHRIDCYKASERSMLGIGSIATEHRGDCCQDLGRLPGLVSRVGRCELSGGVCGRMLYLHHLLTLLITAHTGH